MKIHFIGQLSEITVHTFSESNYRTLILRTKTRCLYKHTNDGNIPIVNKHDETRSVEAQGLRVTCNENGGAVVDCYSPWCFKIIQLH